LRKREAAVIFFVALAVRLAHVWQLRASPFFSLLMGDSRGYDEWALRLAGGDWIGTDVFYQAPLYPYLLGLVYAIAGRHLLLVRVLQAIIGSASCVLLALAAARFFGRPGAPGGRRVGLAAGLTLALYAPAIFFDGLLQKSVLDVFFICVALWLIARITVRLKPDTTHDHMFFWLGVTMGALALTRENALVFIVVIFVWAVTANQNRNQNENREPRTRNPEPRTPNPEPRLARAALFLAGLALVLAPVAARNAYVGGGFYITTSQFGPNFYIGNNARADG